MYKTVRLGHTNEPLDYTVLSVLSDNKLKIGIESIAPWLNKQVLSYDLLNNTWINSSLSLSFLVDFNITTPQANDMLVYNGTQWINTQYIGATHIGTGAVNNTQYNKLSTATSLNTPSTLVIRDAYGNATFTNINT
jgi:hypothetical protein